MLLEALTIGVSLATASGPAAQVGRRAVSWSEVERRLQGARAAGAPADAAAAVEAAVDEAALAQEGERLGLERSPGVQARLEAARKRLGADALLEEVYASARADEATLRALYHDGGDWAQLDEVVLVTRDLAEAAAARLKAGKSFAEEASSSVDPTAASRRGDMGRLSRGQMPPRLAEAAFRAPTGEIVGPIELELGWAVIRVRERAVADEKGFEERRGELARFAETSARAAARRHLVEMLARQRQAAVDEDFLRSLGPRLSFSRPELDHVLAAVGSRTLRLADILPDVTSISRGKVGGHSSGPTLKIEVARLHLERMLLEEEASRRGYARRVPAEDLALARDEALAEVAAERIRAGPKPPGEADVEQAYRERRAEFTQPGRRSCSHVLLADEKEAAEVRRQIAGDASFEAVARHRSRDPSTADRGGLLGDLTDERLAQLDGLEPAFAAAVRLTPPGEVSGPVRTRLGWHLVRCQAPVAGRTAPLAEVREALRQRLAAERGEAALRARLAKLRRELGVRIDQEGLARFAAAPPPPPAASRSSP